MQDIEQIIDTDSRFEEPELLSRRSFLRGTLGSIAAGAMIPSVLSGCSEVKISTDRAVTNEPLWEWIADQFMLKRGLTYMNTGTRGPSPMSIYQAQIDSIRLANENRLGYATNIYTAEYKKKVRTKLADYLGCKPNEVAITNNTTEGMGIGTNGPDLQPGDEIIFTNHCHSSGAQPVNLRCARQGTVPVVVDLSAKSFHPPKSPDDLLKAFEAAITPRTRLISFCHINYGDGCVLPVKEICEMARSKDILTLVDGAHPPGMLEMNLHDLGCDMYAGACHKWMLAAQLTGFLYVREDLQDRIWPSIYSGPVNGLNMYGAPDDAERGKTAERYETHGSTNYAATVSVDAALDFHNEIGPAAIEARDRYLAGKLTTALRNMNGVELFVSEDPRLCGGLVSFKVEGVETKALSEALWQQHQIYIREVVHPEIDWDANRVSLHIMDTAAQVDNLIGAIEEIARERKV